MLHIAEGIQNCQFSYFHKIMKKKEIQAVCIRALKVFMRKNAPIIFVSEIEQMFGLKRITVISAHKGWRSKDKAA